MNFLRIIKKYNILWITAKVEQVVSNRISPPYYLEDKNIQGSVNIHKNLNTFYPQKIILQYT